MPPGWNKTSHRFSNCEDDAFALCERSLLIFGVRMQIILNGINGRYLSEITENAASKTDYVEAAVAYAVDDKLLFEWCWSHQIPLQFWGRFDHSIPVNPRILKTFLARRSSNFVCKLVTRFHSKVIWWHGVGAYIGSANLSDAAWYGNIEAGCYFDQDEISDTPIEIQLRDYFRRVDDESFPLTDELLKDIERRAQDLDKAALEDRDRRDKFMQSQGVKQWNGLLTHSSRTAQEEGRKTFLDEWFATLQILRNIGKRISEDVWRPVWIPDDVPPGAQADQFLHAYYYTNVIDEGRRSRYAEDYELNRSNPEVALAKAMEWWRGQEKAPTVEDRTLLEWAPFLRERLSVDKVQGLSQGEFEEVCKRVWSIQDHARRVANVTLNLPGDRRHDIATKTHALAEFLFDRRAKNGARIQDVIYHVLYDGSDDDLPSRLWDAVSNENWRIEHFGISALGEIVGWALPHRYPPRNNRTSKALRALGNNVTVHD
jgi:hypothetical protein